MKFNINSTIIIISISTLLLACKKEESANMESGTNAAAPATEVEKSVSSTAALQNDKNSKRQFIRTADLKFKVKNVIQSTQNIESIIQKNSGFITSTNLVSEVNHVEEQAVSEENILESKKFVVTNNMTIRVPNIKLDTVLREIAPNIDFLDSRLIKADDVAQLINSNQLVIKDSGENKETLNKAISTDTKNEAESTVNVIDALEKQQDKVKEAKISNSSLQDQIDFSTINLIMYQRESIKRELLLNNKDIAVYQPHFGTKILESLQFGWELLSQLILFIINLWGFISLGVIGFFTYKKYSPYLKKHL